MNEWYMRELKKAAKIIDNNRSHRVAILHNDKYKTKRFFRFVLYCITLCKYSFGLKGAVNKKPPTFLSEAKLSRLNICSYFFKTIINKIIAKTNLVSLTKSISKLNLVFIFESWFVGA